MKFERTVFESKKKPGKRYSDLTPKEQKKDSPGPTSKEKCIGARKGEGRRRRKK